MNRVENAPGVHFLQGGKPRPFRGWPQGQKPSPLAEAKERVTVTEAWHRLNLPGRPGPCVRSPFRPDRKPSFAVFAQGRRWKDHATGESGDVVDFVGLALNLSQADAARWLIQEAGIPPAPGAPRHERPAFAAMADVPEREREPVRFPHDLRPPTVPELDSLARLRSLGREALEEAVRRGLLFTGTLRDGKDGPKVRAWILTDATRRNGQARRLDGKPWQSIGAKAKTLPNSRASWPVGLKDAERPERRAVLLVEGGPDLLAAFHLLHHAGIPAEWVTVAAMLGAGQRLHGDALALLLAKPVWILPQGDKAGEHAALVWAEPLLARGMAVHVFHVARLGHHLPDGQPVKDLNDLCRVPALAGHPNSLRRCRSLCAHLHLNPLPEGAQSHDSE